MAHIDDAIEFDPDLFGSISEECLADATCKDTFQGKLSDHSKKVLGGTDGEIEVNYDFSKVVILNLIKNKRKRFFLIVSSYNKRDIV